MNKELDPAIKEHLGNFIIPVVFQEHLNSFNLDLKIHERSSSEILILHAIIKTPLRLDYTIKLSDAILQKTITDKLVLFDLWLDGIFKVFDQDLNEKAADTLLGFTIAGENLDQILSHLNFDYQLLQFILKVEE